jgi:DHA1 family bicyclomycin/chloramphenicol resistance-like MFS transporter
LSDSTSAAPELTGRRRTAIVVTLGALSAFGPLSMDLYLPSLPSLGRSLGASDSLAQLTMSVCMVGLAAGQLFGGPLSDRFGRRRPLILGVAAFAVTSALCALAPNIGILIALRLVQGLAGSFGIVISRAVVRDLFRGDGAARVFSTLMMVTGVAPVLAPLAGGQIVRVTDWRGLFVVLFVVGVLLCLAALSLPETLPEQERRPAGLRAVGAEFAVLARDRRFTGYALVMSLTGCALFTYISFGTFVLQGGYGLSAQEFSAVFAAISVGIVASGNLNRMMVGRFSPAALVRAGTGIGLAGALLALAAVLGGLGLPALLPGLFVVAAVAGIISPNATAMSMDGHGDRAGSASALLGVLQFTTGAIVPPLVSGAVGATALSMTTTMVAAFTAALAALAAVSSRRPIAEPESAPLVLDPEFK